MILTGPEILKQINCGTIKITPFNERYLNPGSVDLTLGSQVKVYRDYVEVKEPSLIEDGMLLKYLDRGLVQDSKKEPEVLAFQIDPEVGWVLNPGVGYLMHTAERVSTDSYVPVLDGKSSIGRLFIKIHETAGYGDICYDGHYTLEVTSQFPVRVYPGMRICQMRFHTIQGDPVSYQETGTYTNNLSTGPVPSQAWRSAFK